MILSGPVNRLGVIDILIKWDFFLFQEFIIPVCCSVGINMAVENPAKAAIKDDPRGGLHYSKCIPEEVRGTSSIFRQYCRNSLIKIWQAGERG